MPSISVIITTARRDRPWANRSDLRTCDPPVATLANQIDAPPFEVIIADAIKEKRSEQPWSDDLCGVVTPIWLNAENEWHKRGRTGICKQINDAVKIATGDIIVCLSEACMCPPWLLRRIVQLHDNGMWPNLLYIFDTTFAVGALNKTVVLDEKPPTRSYSLLGHTGEHALAEHRWHGLDTMQTNIVTAQWFFGYFTLPRSVFLSVSGLDEAMDGDGIANDNDLGLRIEAAGHTNLFCIDRDAFVVEVATNNGRNWSDSVSERKGDLKCNYAILKWNAHVGRIKADGRLDVERVKTEICGSVCEVREKCQQVDEFYPLTTKRVESQDDLKYWLDTWSIYTKGSTP